MKNEQDLLQKQCDTTINQTDPWYFFLNLADYVRFVNETHPFKEIVEPLKQQKEDLLIELDKYEEKAVSELMSAKKKLEKLVGKVDGLKEKLIKTGFFSDGFTSINKYLANELHTSGTKSDVISRFLYEVARDLSDNGQVKLLDDFTEDLKAKHRVVYFSESLKMRQELTDELNAQRLLNPWGYWDFLSIPANQGMFVWSDLTAIFPNADQTYLSELISVKHEIQESKPPENTFPRIQKQNRDFTRESKVPTYKHYLERIHLYLLKEANRFYNQSELGQKVRFDLDTAILYVGQKEVKFRKFTDQYHTLRVIFSDKNDRKREWFFSEIAEKVDPNKFIKDKAFHNQMSAIKRKVSADASIKDLFLTTTQSVKINEKYFR